MEASFQEYATIENPQAITEEPNEAKLQTLEVSHQNLIISSYQKKKNTFPFEIYQALLATF